MTVMGQVPEWLKLFVIPVTGDEEPEQDSNADTDLGQDDQDADVDGDPQDGSDPQKGKKVYDEAYVRKLRKEAAKWRSRVKEAEGRHDPELVKRLEARLEALEAQAKEAGERARAATIRSAVASVAAAYTPHDMDDIYRHLDLDKFEVKDDGKVEGVEDAVKALAEAKPYLFKTADGASLDPTNPSRTRRKETPEERRARLFGGPNPNVLRSGGVRTNPKQTWR